MANRTALPRMLKTLALAVLVLMDVSCKLSKVQAARILVLSFGDIGSHFRVTRRVGEALVERGHNVTLLVNERQLKLLESSENNFTIVHYGDFQTQQEYDVFWRNFTDRVFQNKIIGKRRGIGEIMGKQILNAFKRRSESMVGNINVIENLRSQIFDLVYFESIASWGGYIAKALDVPFVLMDTLSTSPDTAWVNRADVNPAYYPAFSSGNDARMNFIERCTNTLTYLRVFFNRSLFFRWIEPTNVSHLNITAGLTTPEILGQAEIWFVRTHFALDFARSLPANAVAVGGILTRPAEPLETMLESFVQGSGDHEVIVFSFGSFMKLEREEHISLFLQAFKQLSQRVIMKYESTLPHTYDANNTIALKWLPQNDLVGHLKTKLMIYHCGSHGVFEALYHAVPVICIPLFDDQFDIARRVVSKGIGIQLDFQTLTTERLVHSIHHVLGNPKYQANINRLSAIFRDDPQTPMERVIYWMEFIVRHGGVPHLRSAAHDLNMLQYHLVDVIAAMAAVTIIVMYLMYKLLKLCILRTYFFCTRNNRSLVKRPKND